MMLLTQDDNPANFQIQAFEPGKIKLNQNWIESSLLIDANHALEILPIKLEDLTQETLLLMLPWKPEVVLLGTGPKIKIPPTQLLSFFYEQKLGVEFMDSYAACRTYHVLTSEKRAVAAIILIH